MKKILLTLGVLALSLPVAQAQYDDIYYNPDKPSASRTTQTKKQKQQKKSNYIADFSNMDVDEYNRVGDMYYATPVDTIGTAVENGQDFVYTQQIQKYYNPTIVLDNADLLEDVLNNSYGNVEVVINNNGVPVFSPYYSSVYYNYPFYASWNWGPSWTWTWGPSWTWHWGWGPSWSWGWRPGYYPGWGPSWSWGPGYYPGGWHRPFHADYRPGAHRPTAPRPGWSGNRPRGGNYHGQLAGRPTRGDRYNSPGNGSLTTNRRQYAGNRRGYTDASNSAAISGNRLSTNRSQRVERNLNNANRLQSGTSTSQGTTPNRNYGTSTNRSNRTFNSTSSNRNSYNTNRSTTNRNSYNTNRNSYNNTNRSSYNRSNNSSSYNRSSSYGSSSRSYGGGSRSYGGGGRSGGGHRR